MGTKETKEKFPIFAERFYELRGRRTQGDFAIFLQISRPTVGFYENGERLPDALTLRNIAQRCNVSSDWLIGLSENKNIENKIHGDQLGLSDDAIEVLKAAKQSANDGEKVVEEILEILNKMLGDWPILFVLEEILDIEKHMSRILQNINSENDGNMPTIEELKKQLEYLDVMLYRSRNNHTQMVDHLVNMEDFEDDIQSFMKRYDTEGVVHNVYDKIYQRRVLERLYEYDNAEKQHLNKKKKVL